MIKSTAKVSLDRTDEGTLISIYPQHENWQKLVLGLWLVVWLVCGMFILLGSFVDQQQDVFTFILVFMAFWAYFMFYGARSFLWARIGVEHLRLTQESLDYKRAWGTYGRVSRFDLSTIKNLGKVNYEGKPWAKTYNEAFWTIGGEQIGFDYIGKKIALGFKLSSEDTNQIISEINRAKKRVKS